MKWAVKCFNQHRARQIHGLSLMRRSFEFDYISGLYAWVASLIYMMVPFGGYTDLVEVVAAVMRSGEYIYVLLTFLSPETCSKSIFFLHSCHRKPQCPSLIKKVCPIKHVSRFGRVHCRTLRLQRILKRSFSLLFGCYCFLA